MAKQQRGQKGSALTASNAVRVIVACLAVALIAFSGWSAAQYSNGNDPLAFLTGSGALQTTVEAAEDATPSAAADDQILSEHVSLQAVRRGDCVPGAGLCGDGDNGAVGIAGQGAALQRGRFAKHQPASVNRSRLRGQRLSRRAAKHHRQHQGQHPSLHHESELPSIIGLSRWKTVFHPI